MRYFVLFLGIVMTTISCQETKSNNTSVNAFEPVAIDPVPQDTSDTGMDTTETDPEQIFITDVTGKKWNITHAVTNYGFEASKFQFGVGPNAIRPINNPEFVERNENGFPSSQNTMQIIGTTINGESRAYPLNVLNSREILNDSFEDIHVAVGF